MLTSHAAGVIFRDMDTNTYQIIDDFVNSTRDLISFREIDRLMIIRPGRIFHVTKKKFDMLNSLYTFWSPAEAVAEKLSTGHRSGKDSIIMELSELTESIRSLVRCTHGSTETGFISDYDPSRAKYPVIADIALTYRCQNRCVFCDTAGIDNGNDAEEMSAADVFTVLDRLHDEGKIDMVTFAGGEPTMREDLPLILRYASKKKMKTCIRTNGISCSDRHYVKWLAEAGLDSAEVKLESHDPAIHDRITGHSGSLSLSVNGIHNLIHSGIHTYTNTTVNRLNMEHLMPLLRFIRDEFKLQYLTMDMIPPYAEFPARKNTGNTYSETAEVIKPVMRFCYSEGLRLIWKTPVPHCIPDPGYGIPGLKSCKCISGIIPVTPSGDVLYCSGRGRNRGNLVRHPFSRIWNSAQTISTRKRRYPPPLCSNCTMGKICADEYPVFLSDTGGFSEQEPARNNTSVSGNIFRRRNGKLNLKLRGVKS